MSEPATSDELTQGVKDAQAKFDEGMGAVGDASPYPMLAELRATAAVHRGWHAGCARTRRRATGRREIAAACTGEWPGRSHPGRVSAEHVEFGSAVQ